MTKYFSIILGIFLSSCTIQGKLAYHFEQQSNYTIEKDSIKKIYLLEPVAHIKVIKTKKQRKKKEKRASIINKNDIEISTLVSLENIIDSKWGIPTTIIEIDDLYGRLIKKELLNLYAYPLILPIQFHLCDTAATISLSN